MDPATRYAPSRATGEYNEDLNFSYHNRTRETVGYIPAVNSNKLTIFVRSSPVNMQTTGCYMRVNVPYHLQGLE